MGNTTSGAKGKAQSDSADTAASSATSPANGKPRTRKTVKLTREQAAEILTQAFSYLEETGDELDVTAEGGKVTVVIHDMDFIDGLLVPIPRADKQGA